MSLACFAAAGAKPWRGEGTQGVTLPVRPRVMVWARTCLTRCAALAAPRLESLVYGFLSPRRPWTRWCQNQPFLQTTPLYILAYVGLWRHLLNKWRSTNIAKKTLQGNRSLRHVLDSPKTHIILYPPPHPGPRRINPNNILGQNI